MLVVNAENVGETVVLRCVGRIVAGEENLTLQKAVLSHVGSKVVVLDLAKVETIDGAGMGLLVFLEGWTRAAGIKLRLANLSRYARELLELTNLDSVLELSPSSDMADASNDTAVFSANSAKPAAVAANQ